MQEDKLKQLLSELYELDPGLREHENSLIQLISRMEEIKPDTKFDQAFVARLRAEIIKKEQLVVNSSSLNKIFNFNFMNKKIYLAAGSLVVASLLFVVFINFLPKNTDTPGRFSVSDLINRTITEKEVNKLPAGAFGSLAVLGSSASSNQDSTNFAAAPMGLGGGGKVMATAESTVAYDSAGTVDGFGGMDMMVMPFYGFKYVYGGEELNLSESSADVYRRLKGQNSLARNLAQSLSSVGFSEISLSTFQNLKMTSFSLAEDKDLGLFITFDFNEDNIYIYENWEKWRDPAREACGYDQSCWDKYRLKISDIPADNELMSIAKNFLNKHKVVLTNYGEPRVENYWKEQYEAMPDKNNFYIPEYATVVFPLIINGQEVRDQSGGYAGLRVNINVIKKAASGLSGLAPYRYETSAYALETSASEVIKVAENGGFNRNYYIQGQEENLQTVTLGTPTQAYVQIYRYENGRSDELLVPALIFPVIDRPVSEFYYYGQNYIIVPLVKDILAELNREPDWWPRDGIMEPMPYIDGVGSDSKPGSPDEVRMMPAIEPMIIKE